MRAVWDGDLGWRLGCRLKWPAAFRHLNRGIGGSGPLFLVSYNSYNSHIKTTLYHLVKKLCFSKSEFWKQNFWKNHIVSLVSGFASFLAKTFGSSPNYLQNESIPEAVFSFWRTCYKRWRKRECWCYRHHQQQFQCSSVRVNERALQTEGPSQRAKDDKPGTFLLTWNIPCIMTATSCVVSAAYDGRCVISLSVLSSRSKNPLALSSSQRILLRILLTGLTVSSLLCKLKIWKQKKKKLWTYTKWFWESQSFLSHFPPLLF